MYDERTPEEIEQTKRNLRFVGRFIDKYLTLLLFSLYIYWMPILFTKDPIFGFTVNKSYVIIGAIIGLFMFYSVQRLVTIYTREFANEFLDYDEELQSISQKIKYIFSKKENLLELGIFTALYLFLPFKFTLPCLEWLFLRGNESFLPNLLFGVTVYVLLMLLYIWANLSAMKYWDTKERELRKDMDYLSEKERKRFTKAEKSAFNRMFTAMIIGYYLGSIGLFFLIPAIVTAFSPLLLLLIEPAVYIPVALIILVPPIYRRVKAYQKRKKFFVELKALCKNKRYIVSKLKNPYKSIFRLCEGETFSVRIGDRKYSCKMISSLRRSRPLYIINGGIGGWLIQWKFISIELLSYTKTFSFGWEADCKKILIINPVPKKLLTPKGTSAIPVDEESEYYISPKSGGLKPMVLKVTPKEPTVELDNGDIIGGYEIYTARAFLNALERDVIDID